MIDIVGSRIGRQSRQGQSYGSVDNENSRKSRQELSSDSAGLNRLDKVVKIRYIVTYRAAGELAASCTCNPL